MGPGDRLRNEAGDLNRQVPRQRQWDSAAQTKGELRTVADRPEAVLRAAGRILRTPWLVRSAAS